jgi:integrase
VFGRTTTERFVPSTVRRRAFEAWGWKQLPNPDGPKPKMVWVKDRDDALELITLHEGRHSAATAGGAAGLDDKSLSHIAGHSSVVITKDRYSHIRPDRVVEVGKLLDAYYETASS